MLLIRHRVVLAFGFFSLLTPHMARADAAGASVMLHWTAPGDDGTIGQAVAYTLRFSTSPLTAANFQTGFLVPGVPAPKPAGTQESYRVRGLESGRQYYFAILTTDDAGNTALLSNVASTVAQAVSVGDVPTVLEFPAPWPNPARQVTRVAFALPEAAMVQVEVFDVTGRFRRTLARGWYDPGRTELVWDLRDETGSTVSAGIYLVRARLGARSWTRRIVVAQ